MNRWQALVEIVRSFNERGATPLAFGAVFLTVVAPLLVWMVVAIKLGHAVHLPWFETG